MRINIFKKRVPNEAFLNPKGKDASNYVEDILNDRNKQLPSGFYRITRPIIQTESKINICPNVVIYPTENHSMLKVRASRFEHHFLELNNTLVKEPTFDSIMMDFQFNMVNMIECSIKSVRLIGEQDLLFRNVGAGFTGMNWDSTTEINGGLTKGTGECHRFEIDVMAYNLHTALNMSAIGQRKTSNSAHEIKLKGAFCKRFAIFDEWGSASRIRTIYQNRNMKVGDEEKDYDLVKLNSDWCKIDPTLYDFNKGNKPPTERYGNTLYAHKYAVTNYGEHNQLLNADLEQRYGAIKEIRTFDL